MKHTTQKIYKQITRRVSLVGLGCNKFCANQPITGLENADVI